MYQFHYLSNQIILIIWDSYPSPQEEKVFLKEHQQQLDNATLPLYYISDLRKGRIINIQVINQMSAMTKHPNYGGGTAFSRDPISRLMVKSFKSLSTSAYSKAEIFDTPEEALAFLETLSPGITQDIDWNLYIQ